MSSISPAAWFAWSGACVALAASLMELVRTIQSRTGGRGMLAQARGLDQIADDLIQLQETLESGWVPSPEQWSVMAKFPEPWSTLCQSSIAELRDAGASVVPTLKSLRTLAQAQAVATREAHSKSAQSKLQAMACSGLGPFFAGFLWFMMPALQENAVTWAVTGAFAVALSVMAMLWIIKLSEDARWGGVPLIFRPAVFEVQIAFEKFFALLRSGKPADLAWFEMIRFFSDSPGSLPLFESWGQTVWEPTPEKPELKFFKNAGGRGKPPESVIALIAVGHSLKRMIQASLVDGQSSLERAQTLLLSFQSEWRQRVDAELQKLPTRSLQPLYFCVLPALVGLLVVAMVLTASQSF